MPDFQIIQTLPQATIIHHIDKHGVLWGTNWRMIIRKPNGRWESVARFPFTFPRDLFGFLRPSARAFRADKCNLYQNRLGHLLGIRAGWVYRIESGKVIRLFQINGDCALHGSICEDPDGNMFFGEYFMNPERRPVRVWRVNADLQSWQLAANMEGIRHVHGVYPDPFHQGAFWVTVVDYSG